jgi:hypothetical protein
MIYALLCCALLFATGMAFANRAEAAFWKSRAEFWRENAKEFRGITLRAIEHAASLSRGAQE